MFGSNDAVEANSNGKDIALRLFFKHPLSTNILDEFALHEKKYTVAELFENGDINFNTGLLGAGFVKVVYKDGLLVIDTADEVIVMLSGNIPAIGVHVETRGGFALVGSSALHLKTGMFVNADGIGIDCPVTADDFISLVSNQKADSMVNLNFCLTTDKLKIQTIYLGLDATLRANTASLVAKNFTRMPSSKLYIHDGAFGPKHDQPAESLEPFIESKEAEEVKDWDAVAAKEIAGQDTILPETCLTWRENLKKHIYSRRRSQIIAEDLDFYADSELANADLHIKNLVHFCPNSKTNLSDVVVYATTSQQDKTAELNGAKTNFEIRKGVVIDGKCIIDGYLVSARDLAVTGVLWGENKLQLQIRESSALHGIVGSVNTVIKSKYLTGNALLGNEGLRHKTFVNGGIIGTANLSIDSLVCFFTAGSYLYGPNVTIDTGAYINLLGCVISYNFAKKNVYEKDFGIRLVTLPGSLADLMNANKALRTFELIGSNFPLLRGIVGAYNTAYAVGPLGKRAIKTVLNSLRDNPNPLTQLTNLSHAATEFSKSTLKSAQEGLTYIVDLAMGEWDSDRVKEVVDILLQAKGIYVKGEMLLAQATNTLIFANDFQSCILLNPDLTFENAGIRLNSAYEAARDLTLNPEYRAQVLDDGWSSAVDVFGLSDFKNTMSDAELRSEYISDSFKVTPKNSDGTDGERIFIGAAVKNVASNHLDSVVNAPSTLRDNIVGFADAIQSLNPNSSVTRLYDDASLKFNRFAGAGRAALFFEPSPFPVQFPIMDVTFFRGNAYEVMKMLAPSDYTVSYVSDNGGFKLTGNEVVYAGFYRNSGLTAALGTSVHCLYDISNSGFIFSKQHSETARNRYNSGVVSAQEVTLNLINNDEHGVTEASTRMIFDVKNQYVAKGAKFRSTGQTYGNVTGSFVSDGGTDLRNGFLKISGKIIFGEDASTKAIVMELDAKQGCELNGTTELERVMLNGNEKIKLSDTSTTDTKNVHFIADNFEHEGNLEYEETLQITSKHADLTLGRTVRKSGATSSFGLNTGTLTMPLAAHHENIFVVLTNESSEKSRNLAIGLNDAQHMIVDANITVRTNDATPVEYAGSRADGAHATLITAGPVTLPSQYDRAKNMSFGLYSLADAFIKYDYMYHNLPPELKNKYSTFKKCKKWAEKNILKPAAKVVDKVGGYVATVVTCLPIPGAQVLGAAIGAATVGTQVIRNDHAKKKIDRLEQETLQNLHNQRIMELGLLSDEERAAHAANAEAQHYAKLNAWQQSVLSQTNGDADMSVISEAFAANQALVSNEYANAKNQLNEAYDSYTKEIKKNNSIIKELIDKRSGTKVGIGTSVNAGTSGFNVNVTSQLYTPQGQPINVSYPIYNRDFSNPTYEQHPNTPQHPREEPKVKSERDLAVEGQVHELPGPVSTYEPMSVTTNDQGSTVFSRQVTEPQNNTSAWLHLYNKEMAPIHAAINQLYADEFLTSPGLQYVSPLTLDSYSGSPHGNEHTLNATVAPKNQFADKPLMNVLYSAIDGNINAKQEMRKRAEKLAKFFDSIDPELRIKASDSDVMAELKMYGRAFKGLRDQFIHAVNHPDELVTGPFILGADIIEAGLYYYCDKEYYPVARERNDARMAAVNQLIHADGLTQREAILTMGLAAIFGKVIMAPKVPVIIGPSRPILPAFRNNRAKAIIIENAGTFAPKAQIMQEIGMHLMDNPVAYFSYKRLQQQGTKVVFDFGKVSSNTPRGIFDADLNKVTIYVRANRNSAEIARTISHEAHHQKTMFSQRSRDITSIYEEYKAFRREFLAENGRKPNMHERLMLWNDIYDAYSVFSEYRDASGKVKLGFNQDATPGFLKAKVYFKGMNHE